MTIRPKNIGYCTVYFLAVILSGGSVWAICEHFGGNHQLTAFEFICCIIAPLIFILFSFRLGKVKIQVNDQEIVITQSMWQIKEENENRVDPLLSKNGNTQRMVTQTVELQAIKRYGLTKDLGMDYIEKPPVPNDLYLSQEIVFVMENGEKRSLNARPYTKKSIRQLRDRITRDTGVEPTGSLRDL